MEWELPFWDEMDTMYNVQWYTAMWATTDVWSGGICRMIANNDNYDDDDEDDYGPATPVMAMLPVLFMPFDLQTSFQVSLPLSLADWTSTVEMDTQCSVITTHITIFRLRF